MSSATRVDLSLLPAPDVVEALDFETILAALLADLRSRDSLFDNLSESDPAYKVIEVCAFRDFLDANPDVAALVYGTSEQPEAARDV